MTFTTHHTTNTKFFFLSLLGTVGSAQQRLVRITKEISSLLSNLPTHPSSSIFVVADGEQPNIMKVMITGPDDTPYENGCFLFDVYLPPSYPATPPTVMFQTTNYNKVRFNPNLYAEGKVCLSLLGTWSGPGWNPKESTLLQVLLSIQGCILVDKPFYNEPGYDEKDPSLKRSSEMYNRQIRAATASHAIRDVLRITNNDSSNSKGNPQSNLANCGMLLFKDAVQQHFKIKKALVLEMIDTWEQKVTMQIAPAVAIAPGLPGFNPNSYGMVNSGSNVAGYV